MKSPATVFTRSGFRAGILKIFPLMVPVFAQGAVFGILALKAGLDTVEAFGMSALVTAGSAQFVSLSLWSHPLNAAALILTTLVINLRYILMGASLRPWISGSPPSHIYASLFFLGDENWALSLNEWRNGKTDLAFLLGSGIALYAAWSGGTLAGALAGQEFVDLNRWGLDFAFFAVFAALLAGMWSGWSSVLVSLTSAGVAIAVAHWLPGNWYILAGGLTGIAFGGEKK